MRQRACSTTQRNTAPPPTQTSIDPRADSVQGPAQQQGPSNIFRSPAPLRDVQASTRAFYQALQQPFEILGRPVTVIFRDVCLLAMRQQIETLCQGFA